MTFKHPFVLLLIPILILLFVWLRRRGGEPAFIFPTDYIISELKGSFKAWASSKTVYIKLAALVLLVIAFASPQVADESIKRKEGIGVMLAIDCSSTMLAEDLQMGATGLLDVFEDPAAGKVKRLNRLDAVKEAARAFVIATPEDMTGIVAFAAYAYVLCPPTFDHEWVLKSIDRLSVGMIKDATALGSGILAGANALSAVKAKSKVLILLTDGNSNYGKVPPLIAAKTARTLGVKIYAIGIAGKAQALYPTKDREGRKTYKYVEIPFNEAGMRKIAEITGGEYYQVTNLQSLEDSYAAIYRLEKSLLEERQRENGRDIFYVFLYWALGLILIDIIMSNTYLRRIP